MSEIISHTDSSILSLKPVLSFPTCCPMLLQSKTGLFSSRRLETEVSQNYGMRIEETRVGGQSWGSERGKKGKGPKVCDDVVMKPVTSYAGFKTNGPKEMGNRKQIAVTNKHTTNTSQELIFYMKFQPHVNGFLSLLLRQKLLP